MTKKHKNIGYFFKMFPISIAKNSPAQGSGNHCSAPSVKLAFSCCFRFLLTSYAGLLVMLSLTNFLLNACFGTVSFKTA